MPTERDLELTSGWLWSPHKRPFQAKCEKKKCHDFHSSWRSTKFRIHSMSFRACQSSSKAKLHIFLLRLPRSRLFQQGQQGRQTQSAFTGDEVQLDKWRERLNREQGEKMRGTSGREGGCYS